MKKFLSSIILIFSLFSPVVSLALELKYPEFGGYKIELGMNINQLVAWFYYFIVGVAGLAAFVMLIWGGFQWLTSAGNPARITDAKDKITSALLGLLIILSSWLILQVINPELTILKLPGLP